VTPWRALLDEARARLEEREARWLVEEVSGWEGADHVVHLDDPVTERAVARFDQLVARRLAGEPIQYVLGHWSFRTLDLMVDGRVLIPRPETEGLVDHALASLAGPGVAVDLGTGSGAIALSLAAEHRDVEVWATDASPDAVAVARANLAGIGMYAAPRVRIAEGDWFEALPDELRGHLSLVVSNPPYVAEGEPLPDVVCHWEPVGALISGPTGIEAIERILADAPAWLTGGGSLVLEIGETQGRAVTTLAHDAGFEDVTIHPDLAGRDRYLVAR
jgi:release factor glutamine methyltransferase